MKELKTLLDIRQEVGEERYKEFETVAHYRLVASHYFHRETEARHAFTYAIMVHLYEEYKTGERVAEMASREVLGE